MAQVNIDKLVQDVVAAASKAMDKDITTVDGFSRTQIQGLATQAAWIASARAAGELDDDLYLYFIGNLKRTAENFVAVLRGLSILAVEKVFNAVIGVVVESLSDAIGI